MKKIALVVMLVMGMFTLSGCAWMNSLANSEKNETLRLVIQESVEAMIIANPEYQERVLEITADGRAFMAANPVASAGEIIDVLRAEIHWESLTENQVVLLNTALTLAQANIAQAIADGELKESAAARVGKYFDWAEQTALMGQALTGAQ